MLKKAITVIGAGLAGSEAAWQLAEAGYQVRLFEMRPQRPTPAHRGSDLAELVCSNSLGSEYLTTARGLLIAEMEHFASLIISAAKNNKVPAGQALAVDREKFAAEITTKISQHPNIELIREELTAIPEEGDVIIATGPLTSEALAADIQNLLKKSRPDLNETAFLNFYDAASPILSADSIDMSVAFKASRYGKGDDDYINCPFYDEEQFENFYQELIAAEKAPQKDFEKGAKYFESCLPIEVIASRGKQTMCFGPLKPVGLTDPRYPDKKAIAVVQLRQDNAVASLYNIVGFQTNLKWGEQKRVFSMIPGLENMEIVRYGVMHQNIYLNSPAFLNSDFSLRNISGRKIYFAGQITGVEGYTESAATGIIVARNILFAAGHCERSARHCEECNDEAAPQASTQTDRHVAYAPRDDGAANLFPAETMMGALARYISNPEIEKAKQDFQPMNSNWGLINFGLDLNKKQRRDKKFRNEKLVERALAVLS